MYATSYLVPTYISSIFCEDELCLILINMLNFYRYTIAICIHAPDSDRYLKKNYIESVSLMSIYIGFFPTWVYIF